MPGGRADRLQRCHRPARRRRGQRRRHGDQRPDGQPGEHRPGRQRQPRRRQRGPQAAQQRLQPGGRAHPGGDAGGRGDQPHDGGLGQHRTEHLPAGRAEQPQQGHLAGAARDQHREGVPDDERADQQRHRRKGQQRRPEPVQVALDLVGLPGGERRGGDRLQPPGRQQPADPVAQHVRAHPRRGAHLDLVDGVAAAEQALRRGGLQHRHGRGVEGVELGGRALGAGEAGHPREAEAVQRAVGAHDPQAVAQPPATQAGGGLVQHGLTVAPRRPALPQHVAGGQDRVGRPAHHQVGRAPVADRPAVAADHRHLLPDHHPGRRTDPGHRPDRGDQVGPDGPRRAGLGVVGVVG